jgi:hypothetical protein
MHALKLVDWCARDEICCIELVDWMDSIFLVASVLVLQHSYRRLGTLTMDGWMDDEIFLHVFL